MNDSEISKGFRASMVVLRKILCLARFLNISSPLFPQHYPSPLISRERSLPFPLTIVSTANFETEKITRTKLEGTDPPIF